MSIKNRNKALLEQSHGVFGKFCKTIANADLGHAGAIAMGVGVAAVLVGIGVEVQHQSDLIATGGSKALHAYKELCQAYGQTHSTTEMLTDSIKGNTPSAGGSLQVIGLLAGSVAPAATMGSIMLARSVEKIKEWAANRAPEQQAGPQVKGPGMR